MGTVNRNRVCVITNKGPSRHHLASSIWHTRGTLVIIECIKVVPHANTRRPRTYAMTPQWPTGQCIPATRFRRKLLDWFDQNKRDLPWRKDRDAYRIWVSEIMLQQTRVAVVTGHYENFIARFPTIERLAAARRSSVLSAWSGLGYYRRARMLHEASKEIVRERSGNFPNTAAELRHLPGVGHYTSAAIASIAFGEPIAVVDGNVQRVLQRLSGKHLRNRELWQAAGHLLDQSRPGDFNQGVMELGATICLPRKPQCLLCPIAEMCVTRGELAGVQKPKPQRKRVVCYALDCRTGSVFLVRRQKSATLMPGMWELPEIPFSNSSAVISFKLRHSITVTNYVVHVVLGAAPREIEGRWVTKSRASGLPLTGLARKILRKAKVI
jgi:A/G-specific adenine glycosylase